MISDDEIYIRRTLSGDTTAFSMLVERYQVMIYSMIVRMVRHRQDAEDIAQDVFVKAFSSLGSFRGESRFSTWLCRIAYTTAISYTRRNRPDQAGIEVENEYAVTDGADDGIIREERLFRLQQLLDRLTPEDAVLISLYYQHDKPVDEIASITGLSASNVKVRLHRIRKKLHEEIKY